MGVTTVVPGSPGAVALALGVARSSSARYDWGVDLIDEDGALLEELSGIADPSNAAQVSRDCNATTPGTFDFTLEESLVWGASLVAPYQLISARDFENGEVFRFPLGVYVATSPSQPLDTASNTCICYDKNYLLKSDIGDTFSALDGTYYSDGVATLLDMAGVNNVKVAGKLNPLVVNFPSDWAVKTVPTGTNMIFPSDDSSNYQFLDVVNNLLAASGMRAIYTDQLGKYTITPLGTGEKVSPMWNFARTAVAPYVQPWEFPQHDNVVKGSAVYESDLWGLPNQFVFVQNGLTFEPVEGSGQFTINNNATDPVHYRPPSDQQTLGRVVRSVQRLDASGQPDLIKQAEKIYADAFTSAEQIDVKTASMPCAWHFDVFNYLDDTLTRAPGRKVQTQSWALPLNGDDMIWRTNAVALLELP